MIFHKSLKRAMLAPLPHKEVSYGGIRGTSATWDVQISLWPQPTMLAKMKVAQLCPNLCDPMDYTVHGILQARILEWVAFPFSRGSSQPRDQTQVSCIAGRFFTS